MENNKNKCNMVSVASEDFKETENEITTEKTTSSYIKHEVSSLVRKCAEKDIPVFVTYYIPGKGYQYNGIWPQEINSEDVKSEYDHFNEFFKLICGFKKENYFPHIR